MNIPIQALGLLRDVPVTISVELGTVAMRLRDVCTLVSDQVVMLDRLVDEPIDLLANGKIVARGEVVATGNRFGLRILELVDADADAAGGPIPLPITEPTSTIPEAMLP